MTRREKPVEFMGEINITPFADVVLVLLIIFMITTPMIIKSGIQVKAPKAQTSQPEQGKFCTISIDAQENVFWDEKKVPLGDLRRLVEPRVQLNPGVVVKINGDKSIKYNIVMKILDATRAAGAAQYVLVAERMKPGMIRGMRNGKEETERP
jgi:biopolymer transport protein ExbD